MNTEPNAYRTPNTVADSNPAASARGKLATRRTLVLWLLAFFYPVWLVGSFYLIWLIAWVQLGHRPRPMLDDPKSVGGILGIAYYVPGILLMLMPVMVLIGLAASFFCPIKPRRGLRYAWAAALAAIFAVQCAVALLTLRFDPARAVEWWFD